MKYTILTVALATLSFLSSAVLASPLPATDGLNAELIHHCPAGYHYVESTQKCIRRPYHGPVNTVTSRDEPLFSAEKCPTDWQQPDGRCWPKAIPRDVPHPELCGQNEKIDADGKCVRIFKTRSPIEPPTAIPRACDATFSRVPCIENFSGVYKPTYPDCPDTLFGPTSFTECLFTHFSHALQETTR